MFDRRSKIAFIVTCLLLAGSRGAFEAVQRILGAYLHKERVPLRQEFTRISKQIGEWRSTEPDQIYDEAVVETLGTRMYLTRNYQRSEGVPSRIQIHVAYYTGLIDPVPHVPDRCFVAAGLNAKSLPDNIQLPMEMSGWSVQADRINFATGQPYSTVVLPHPFTGEPMTLTMPIGDLRLRTTEFEDDRNPRYRIFAGYFFVANGRLTPSPDGVRLLAFDLSERYAYYCKVQLQVFAPADFDKAQFITLSAEFLDDFLPELMRCLPDWWEVERRDEAKSDG